MEWINRNTLLIHLWIQATWKANKSFCVLFFLHMLLLSLLISKQVEECKSSVLIQDEFMLLKAFCMIVLLNHTRLAPDQQRVRTAGVSGHSSINTLVILMASAWVPGRYTHKTNTVHMILFSNRNLHEIWNKFPEELIKTEVLPAAHSSPLRSGSRHYGWLCSLSQHSLLSGPGHCGLWLWKEPKSILMDYWLRSTQNKTQKGKRVMAHEHKPTLSCLWVHSLQISISPRNVKRLL